MKPLRDWMIFEKYEHARANLVMPDSFKEKADESAAFRVVARGPGIEENGKFLNFSDVQVGSIVVMEGMGVAKFSYNNKTYLGGQMRFVAFLAPEIEEGSSDDD